MNVYFFFFFFFMDNKFFYQGNVSEIRWMSDSDDEVIHVHVKQPTKKINENENTENIIQTSAKRKANKKITPQISDFVTPQRNPIQKSYTQERIETPQYLNSQFSTPFSQSQTEFDNSSFSQSFVSEIPKQTLQDISQFSAYKQTYESMKPIVRENKQRIANKTEKLKKLRKTHETKLHEQEIQNNKLVAVLQKERFELEQKIEFSKKELQKKEEMKQTNENYSKTLEINAKIKDEKESFKAVSASIRTLNQILSNNILHEDDFKEIYNDNPFSGEVGEKYKELVTLMENCFLSKQKEELMFN